MHEMTAHIQIDQGVGQLACMCTRSILAFKPSALKRGSDSSRS